MKLNRVIKVSFILQIVKQILLTCLFISIAYTLPAQDAETWNNKKAAVALTYDDALITQLENAVPLLDSLNLKATFYLTGNFPGFRTNIDRWRTVAENGHELGNHTLFHPCEGQAPGREWVPLDYDLNNYSIQRMVDEIRMTNVLLEAVDNRSKRTFAYPCGDISAGDSSYVGNIEDDFIAARGVERKMQRIDEIELFDIGSFMINGATGEELIDMVKEARASNTLLVFLFHGVGGGHSLNVSTEAHSQLLHYLKQNEGEIWIASLAEIVGYVNKR